MKIREEIANVYSIYDKYLAKKSEPTLSVDIPRLLSNFFCPGPHYYYVIDSPTLIIESASESALEILGNPLVNESLMVIVDHIHPDDIAFMLKCEEYVADFLQNKIAPEKITHYKISYCLREKTRDGSYKLFLMQNITLKTNPEGSLLKVLGIHSDISHITQTNNYTLSLIGLNGEPSFSGIDVLGTLPSPQSTPNPFTIREIEVIRLLMQGYISKEIAAILNISQETTNSHKKNALKKSNSKNSVQLVAYAIKNGLI